MNELNETGNIVFKHMSIARLIHRILIWVTGLIVLICGFLTQKWITIPISIIFLVVAELNMRSLIKEYFELLNE